jgi:hypothetical protein
VVDGLLGIPQSRDCLSWGGQGAVTLSMTKPFEPAGALPSSCPSARVIGRHALIHPPEYLAGNTNALIPADTLDSLCVLWQDVDMVLKQHRLLCFGAEPHTETRAEPELHQGQGMPALCDDRLHERVFESICYMLVPLVLLIAKACPPACVDVSRAGSMSGAWE